MYTPPKTFADGLLRPAAGKQKRRRSRGGRAYGLLCILTLIAGLATGVQAQSVQADVRLTRPITPASNRLDILRDSPRGQIGLFYSEQTAHFNPDYAVTVREAVRQWEQLLIGLELPYRVLEDTSLVRLAADSLRLLILPAAEALSDRQQQAIRQHLERGGGLIAAGRIGFVDHRGVVQNDRFFKEIFSAEPSIDLPDTLLGLLHTIEGGHPPTAGIPAGFRLNISRPSFGMAAMPIHSKAMGYIVPYRSTSIRLIDEALAASTLMLRGTYRAGRFVWLGFNPQDVEQTDRQQSVYQAMILNAMAYAAGIPAVSVRPWPRGNRSAASLAMLPSSGYRPYPYRTSVDLILRSLEQTDTPATYFLVTGHAADHPDMLERMAKQGELAISSDTDDLLADQPESQQSDRLQHARLSLARAASGPIRGVYPPGGFYDAKTLKAILQGGLQYLLTEEQTLDCPDFIPWEAWLDYRDPMLESSLDTSYQAMDMSTPEDISPEHQVLMFHPSFFSYELATPRPFSSDEIVPEGWLDVLTETFARSHRAEGHYVFAFEPEFMGLSIDRARILGDFSRHLHRQSTWLATLGEVSEWWLKRRLVSVELVSPEPDILDILVRNGGDAELDGVSLDVILEAAWQRGADMSSRRLIVSRTETEDGFTAVIDRLPPGEHAIRLSRHRGASATTEQAQE